jgi:hypothetical protein
MKTLFVVRLVGELINVVLTLHMTLKGRRYKTRKYRR